MLVINSRVTLINPLLTITKDALISVFLHHVDRKKVYREVLVLRMGRSNGMPKFQPRKVVHLKRWTGFFETFLVGSIQL